MIITLKVLQPGDVCFFISWDFHQSLSIHFVYMISPFSSPSYDILNLADIADVWRILSCRMLPMMHLEVLISVVPGRRLLMLVSALVSMA